MTVTYSDIVGNTLAKNLITLCYTEDMMPMIDEHWKMKSNNKKEFKYKDYSLPHMDIRLE